MSVDSNTINVSTTDGHTYTITGHVQVNVQYSHGSSGWSMSGVRTDKLAPEESYVTLIYPPYRRSKRYPLLKFVAAVEEASKELEHTAKKTAHIKSYLLTTYSGNCDLFVKNLAEFSGSERLCSLVKSKLKVKLHKLKDESDQTTFYKSENDKRSTKLKNYAQRNKHGR